MVRNPVMFVAMVGAVVTTAKLFYTPLQGGSFGFFLQIALWLWFTVFFANFAEAMAEGRGKAQAATLRKARTQTMANRRLPNGAIETVPAESLRKDDIFVVKAGEMIPADGEVIEGAATVDESAITGESAPVIREAGGDRSAVTGGTRVLSDEIVVRVTANPGESFMDRMIGLVEGASRQKTPNEIALTILLSALTIIFLVVIVTLKPFGAYAGGGLLRPGAGRPAGLPDPHHHRRPAERHRHRRHRPAGAEKRAGHERPGRRGRGRRGRAAAGQDRHHHPGQPPGGGVPPGPGRRREGTGRRGPARLPGRRNPGGPEHRGAGQGIRPAGTGFA